MKKISIVFAKSFAENGVTPILSSEVRPGNEWVIAGEGVATIKKDGTAACIQGGQLYVRYSRKLNKKWHRVRHTITEFLPEMFKDIPEGSILCNAMPDKVSGHWPCWVPCRRDDPSHKYAFEAFDALADKVDGTYELIGPTLRCNPHKLSSHQLYRHGSEVVEVSDYSKEGLGALLAALDEEGLVFHHKSQEGVMAKIRRKDYDLVWNPEADPRDLRQKGDDA